jgi:hypothetical protein
VTTPVDASFSPPTASSGTTVFLGTGSVGVLVVGLPPEVVVVPGVGGGVVAATAACGVAVTAVSSAAPAHSEAAAALRRRPRHTASWRRWTRIRTGS